MNLTNRIPSLLLAALLIPASADGLIITNDVTINADDPVYQGADLEIAGCTVTVSGNLALSSLRLASGAILTNAAPPSQPSSLSLVVSNNLEIAADARIDATGKGLAKTFGGISGSSSTYVLNGVTFKVGSGGGYGGNGGRSISGVAGGFGSGAVSLIPGAFGSIGGAGGTAEPLTPGGSGGGWIELRVGGELVVKGQILADGNPASADGAGGGSGGSIYIVAKALRGDGVISANGGAGHMPFGGGGGGGRIAIEAANSFAGTIRAFGGAGAGYGGAGTIWVWHRSVSEDPSVIVDAGGISGEMSSLASARDAVVTIRNGARVNPESTMLAKSLVIASNGFLVYVPSRYPLPPWVSVAEDLTVELGGVISADGLLFSGSSSGFADAQPGTGGGGASCGYGGSSTNNTGGGSATARLFGNWPPLSGSGAGLGGSQMKSAGAGGVQLRVGGTLKLDGIITARGTPGSGRGTGGGGGGAIVLEPAVFLGTGLLDASGGDGELPDPGGGGGGAIVITAQTNLFTGTARAFGGRGANNGGTGLIAIKGAPGQSDRYHVLMDGGGFAGTNSYMGLAGTNDLTVSGGAITELNEKGDFNRLLVQSNSWLTFARKMNPTGQGRIGASEFVIANGGGIHMDGHGRDGYSPTAVGNGAGYGGEGGRMTKFQGLATYGIADAPTQSGNPALSTVTAGGGALEITVRGPLTVDGIISSSATNAPPGQLVGGGAGGSIRIRAQTLSGQGWIRADGGAGAPGISCGGGGGRITVYSDQDLFTGPITAAGGKGVVNGGAGTVMRQSAADVVPRIIVDNAGPTAMKTSLGSTSSRYDLIVTGGAELVKPFGNVRNLSVSAGARLFIPDHSLLTSLEFEIVEIGSGAGISASATNAFTSVPRFQGTGQSVTNESGQVSGGGGGNGGNGGMGIWGAAGGAAWGLPNEKASGGGFGGFASISTMANGGAPCCLKMKELRLDGYIESNGANGLDGDGGGAGGSIFIEAASFSGSGTIRANGGAGGAGRGGGGGGGRIVVLTETNAFNGTTQALGGEGFENGGAGTTYIESRDTGSLLTVNNAGRTGALTPLTLTNRAALRITGAARVYPAEALVVDTLELLAGSSLVQSNIVVSASDQVSIDPTSSIDASGRGFGPGTGPGAGIFGADDGSGGAYGGPGGPSASGLLGGAAYGDPFQPAAPGSGGGAPESAASSRGGGIVRLTAGEAITVRGRISADGMHGLSPGAGGGAGGTVHLASSSLKGDGAISARGGDGYADRGGGGSGGRIAIYAAEDAFTGLISTPGGGGSHTGERGTIARATAAPVATIMFREATPVLMWRVPVGWQYRVLTSTNLVDWEPLTNPVLNQDGECSSALSAQSIWRFFRVGVFPAD